MASLLELPTRPLLFLLQKLWNPAYKRFGLRRKGRIKEQEAWNPQVRPRVPKRRLTIPVAPQDALPSSQQQQTYDQLQSNFFSKLPFEIRLQIYQEALGDYLIYIVRSYGSNLGRLTHHGTKLGAERNTQEYNVYRLHSPTMLQVPGPFSERGMLNLALSCRRVYSEVIDIIYATNTFHLRQGPSVGITWLEDTLLQRLNQVRSLRVELALSQVVFVNGIWKDFWSRIARMEKLKTLQVRLYVGADEEWLMHHLQSQGVWDPVCEVRQPKFFELIDQLGDVNTAQMPTNAPFRIARVGCKDLEPYGADWIEP